MLLTYDFADVGDIFLGSHEIGEVIDMELVQTTGDDGVVVTLDSHDVIGVVWTAEVFQWLVEYLCTLAELDAKQDECSTVYIPSLANP